MPLGSGARALPVVLAAISCSSAAISGVALVTGKLCSPASVHRALIGYVLNVLGVLNVLNNLSVLEVLNGQTQTVLVENFICRHRSPTSARWASVFQTTGCLKTRRAHSSVCEGWSSVVEHLNADQGLTGSNPPCASLWMKASAR